MSFENEDMILPDDFQETPPQAEEIVEETPVSEEVETIETEPTEQEPQLTPEELRFKVKYNHEEQELGYDEAVPLIQKGMNYDKIQQRVQELESDPRLSFVEELAKEQGMDTQEFLEAVQTAREEQKLNELIQQNIPEEYAKKMLEVDKLLAKQTEQEKAQQQEAAKNQEFGEFFEFYKQAEGRDFNPQSDQIPQEVWDLNAQGVPMKFAYMQHHMNQLQQQNSELQSQLKTKKHNEENERRAPISGTTQYGSTTTESTDPFLSGFDSIK